MHIIDWHCDTVLGMLDSKENSELKCNNLSIDIEKLKKGNSMAQFFALFVNLKGDFDPTYEALRMADKFHTEIEKNADSINFAKNYDEIINNHKNGKISALLTIEEGGVIKDNLYLLRDFYRLGVRLITLSWNFPNTLGYPNCETQYMNKGLTDFGKEVVQEMNKLGMIIDVSHLSDGGFYDVAKLSTQPFVASHSNARAVTNHPRNLTDEMIKILAEKGGVMGLNFANSFLGESDISRVCDMVEHLKHIKNVGGIEVMALGTDFDGISPNLEIKNMGEIDKLICALQKSGFTEDELEKMFYKNSLRVIKDILK